MPCAKARTDSIFSTHNYPQALPRESLTAPQASALAPSPQILFALSQHVVSRRALSIRIARPVGRPPVAFIAGWDRSNSVVV